MVTFRKGGGGRIRKRNNGMSTRSKLFYFLKKIQQTSTVKNKSC